MKTQETIAGKLYTVTSPNGCTVSDETGLTLGTVDAGTQKAFVATGAQLAVDDDAARVTATFNGAALVLRLLGGGVNSELPAGYLRAEFLESVKGSGYPLIEIPASFNPTEDTFSIETLHAIVIDGWLYFECKYNDYRIGYGVYSQKGAMFDVGARSIIGTDSIENGQWLNFHLSSTPSKTVGVCNGEKILDSSKALDSIDVEKLWLFRAYRDNGSHRDFYGKKKYWKLTLNSQIERYMLPAVSALGEPCMYDKVHKEAFTNVGSGSFVAGFTIAQARKLGKHLPEGGGSLTISLPTGYEQDAGVAESLETARAKGWTLTVQTYTTEAEAAAATFGMRRIWVRRTQDEHGAYVDADGVRWAVEWCVDMVTPDSRTPDAHGYELYRSTEAAVAYWELEPWTDPKAEELLTTESL